MEQPQRAKPTSFAGFGPEYRVFQRAGFSWTPGLTFFRTQGTIAPPERILTILLEY